MSNASNSQHTMVQTTAQNKFGLETTSKKGEREKGKEGMYPIRTPAANKEHCLYQGLLSGQSTDNLLHGQTEVLIGGHHTNGVGVAHTTTPSLDADNGVALVDDTELETVVDTPLEAAVDILLPNLDVEVGLVLGEIEGPNTTVQVGVLENVVSKCQLCQSSGLDLRGQHGRYE